MPHQRLTSFFRLTLTGFCAALLLCLAGSAGAQAPRLDVEDVVLSTQADIFGAQRQTASGLVVNNTEDAYADVALLAEVYDADDELVGEGTGILVNQCGKNTPPDFLLMPEHEQRFEILLDMYEADATIERVEIFPQGRAVGTESMPVADSVRGIRPISDREVAGLEWVTEEAEQNGQTVRRVTGIRYGEGCHREVFSTYRWYEYDLAQDATRPVEHPRFEAATAFETRERLGLLDDLLYERSYLSYAPDGTRLIHQTDLNALISAEDNGTYRRLIDDELFRSTLQGVNWLADERFVAYYYGAYGDPVTYLVASTFGQYISTPERFSIASVTVPGALPDGGTLIISGTFNDDETPGFYLKPAAAERFERLFDWETLPGNNYPAPVYRSRGGVQAEDVIYFVLPNAEASPRLYCYDRREADLADLAALPLQLGTEDRATMVLSPERNQIALGANGVNGGLWLLELSAFDACPLE